MGYLVKNSTFVQNLSVLSFGSEKMQKISSIFRSRISWFWPCKQHVIGGRNITAGRPEACRQADRKEYYKKYRKKGVILNKCNSDGLETHQAMDTHFKSTKGKKLSQSKTNQAMDTQPNHTKGKELSPLKTNQATDTYLNCTEENELSEQATVLVFDIESTGFSPTDDRIIEFAAQDLAGGGYSTFQSLVNPECIVTNGHIHGISTQMVNKPDVPRWKDLAPILVQYVRSRQKAGGPVIWVGHNSRRFDARFVAQEFNRCSMQIPYDWLFVDTLPLAQQVMLSSADSNWIWKQLDLETSWNYKQLELEASWNFTSALSSLLSLKLLQFFCCTCISARLAVDNSSSLFLIAYEQLKILESTSDE